MLIVFCCFAIKGESERRCGFIATVAGCDFMAHRCSGTKSEGNTVKKPQKPWYGPSELV